MMRSVRYGAKIRRLVTSALRAKQSSYECPKCGKTKVKRRSNALWQCRSCESTFAGGAYSFTTGVGVVAARTIREYDS